MCLALLDIAAQSFFVRMHRHRENFYLEPAQFKIAFFAISFELCGNFAVFVAHIIFALYCAGFLFFCPVDTRSM